MQISAMCYQNISSIVRLHNEISKNGSKILGVSHGIFQEAPQTELRCIYKKSLIIVEKASTCTKVIKLVNWGWKVRLLSCSLSLIHQSDCRLRLICWSRLQFFEVFTSNIISSSRNCILYLHNRCWSLVALVFAASALLRTTSACNGLSRRHSSNGWWLM